jgi:hypothetical protein
VVGDGKGKVGFGYGKAKEVPVAIKAMQAARKHMMHDLKGNTLFYAANGRHGTSNVYIRLRPTYWPDPPAAARAVFEAAGVRNVLARATVRAIRSTWYVPRCGTQLRSPTKLPPSAASVSKKLWAEHHGEDTAATGKQVKVTLIEQVWSTKP